MKSKDTDFNTENPQGGANALTANTFWLMTLIGHNCFLIGCFLMWHNHFLPHNQNCSSGSLQVIHIISVLTVFISGYTAPFFLNINKGRGCLGLYCWSNPVSCGVRGEECDGQLFLWQTADCGSLLQSAETSNWWHFVFFTLWYSQCRSNRETAMSIKNLPSFIWIMQTQSWN